MAGEEESKAIEWPGGADEATDFDYLLVGKDGVPIMKIPKEKLNEVIVINGEGVKAVAGGATSANPTILRPGPTGANRKMEDVEGWFVNGTAAEPPVSVGEPWEAPTGFKNTNWWDGTTWSLGSSVPLPSTPVANDYGTSATDAISQAKATETKNVVDSIESLLKTGALFFGYKNTSWQPTSDELNRAFFIYAVQGTYANLGGIVIAERETALIYHKRIKNASDQWTSEYSKYSIRSENMLINTDGYLYGGYVAPNTVPVMVKPFLRYIYNARIAGTYVNCGGLVVNVGESAFLRWTPNADGSSGTWDKIVVAKRGDVVVAADDSPAEWKAIADAQASATDGIGQINNAFTLVSPGGVIVLASGTFTVTNSSDTKTVNPNKNVEIWGQGESTYINTNGDELDIRIMVDGIFVKVNNVKVRKGIGLAKKSTYVFYNSNIVQQNIFNNDGAIDVDVPNYIFKNKYVTIRAFNTPAPFKYYANWGASTAGGDLPFINTVTLNTLPAWDGTNLEARTILILPGDYVSNTGVLIRSNSGTRYLGLPNYGDKVKVENTGGTMVEPNDFYGNSAILRSDLPQVIENINFKRHINHKYLRNLVVKGCYRDGVAIEDYDSKKRSIPVGYGKLHARLDYANRAFSFLAKTDNSERWAIHVYGEIREVTGILAYYKNVDMYGHNNARVIRVGLDLGIVSDDAITPAVTFQNNFDGTVKDIEFNLAGTLRGYNVPAINVSSKLVGPRFHNVVGRSFVLPGKRTEDNKRIVADIDGRAFNYADNGDGTFTKTEYYLFDGSQLGSEVVTTSVEHTHYLPIRKSDDEIEKVGWEDYYGGRLYGWLIGVTPDSDIEMHNCHGYGSPWGYHNTRGIYWNYGKVRAYNCLGVGGGIGHRNHGIINHRNTSCELFNCVGIASPFAYLTPMDVHDRGSHNGIKFQMMSSSKLVGCIGYGNNMERGHGIAADMRTQPNLINCIGYNGGGVDSAGLFVAELSTVMANGGYFGAHYKTSNFSFIANQGNGMRVYPYKNPVRYGETLDDVLYKNHWDATQDDTTQNYRLVNLTVNRSNNIISSGLGGITSVCVYAMNGATKTLISKQTLANINGNYQYMPIAPIVVNAAAGDYLYVCLEYNSDGREAVVPNNLISLVTNTTEVAEGLSSAYMAQYWSHESDIPVDTTIRAAKPTTISGATLEQEIALRIGEKADITQEYNIVLSTLNGITVKDVASTNPVRKYNCVDIINGEVQ